MRLVAPCAILLSLCTCVPAFSQNAMLAAGSATPAPAATPTTTAAEPEAASVDYEALRADVARQNKVLADKVAAQKALVHKNETILRDAQKMDAANKRLDAERKRLEVANAELEKQRQTLAATQKASSDASAAAAAQTGGN